MSQSAKQQKVLEQQQAVEKLREWLKPGDTVQTILRHVSRSGMQREVSVVIKAFDATYFAARALGDRIGKWDGIVMGGCGMDMGAAVVYNLGSVMYRDGYGCVGEKCRSNDHSNGDRNYTPHCIGMDKDGNQLRSFNCDAGEACKGAHWHTDGGYAFQQRWL